MLNRLDYLFRSFTKYPLVVFSFTSLIYFIIYNSINSISLYIMFLYCVLMFLYSKKIKILILIIFSLFLSQFRINQISKLNENNISNFVNSNWVLQGQILNYPYTKGFNKILIVKPEFLESTDKTNKVKVYNGLIQIKVSKLYDLNKGDLISGEGSLIDPPVFDKFNYKEYLKSQEIYALFTFTDNIEIQKSNLNLFEKTVQNFRNELIYKVRRLLPEPHASLLLGILIGTREEFPGNFSENLSKTGTTHIIAVSGFNVTVIVSLVLALAGKVPRKFAQYLSIFVLLFYISIVGFDNLPALRAVIMGLASITGMMMGRKSSVFSLLSLAVFLMVYKNPFVYQSLSFQLSFASTLGLVLFSKDVEKFLTKFIKTNWIEELSVTLAAIIFTFPITFSKFGNITIWAPLTNLLVGPLIPGTMYLGGILILIIFLIPFIAKVFCSFVWVILQVIIQIISKIGSFPLSGFKLDNNLNLISNIYLLVLLILVFEIKYQNNKIEKFS